MCVFLITGAFVGGVFTKALSASLSYVFHY